MPAKSRSYYGHLPLVLALALALTGCGADRSAPDEGAGGTTAEQGATKEELPPPPEPAEAPPLAEEPEGEVVEIGAAPEGLVFDPGTGLVAAGLRDPDALALVDGESGAVVRRVPLAESPRHLQLAGPGGPVLVPAERANELIRVGLPNGEVVGETPVGEFPHDAAADGSEGRVFVANEFGDSVSVVEGDREIEELEAPVQPGGVAVTGGGVVGVVGVRGLMLEAYDADTLRSLGRIEAGEGPTHILSGPDDRFSVADTRGGAILVYGTRPKLELLHRVALSGSPYGLAVDAERRQLWVTLTAENRVVGYALGMGAPRRLDDYPTARQPNSVAVDPATGRVFVASATDGTLQLLDPR